MKKAHNITGSFNLILRLLLLSIFALSTKANAQNGASINTSGAPSDPSAMLDVSSVNSGLLIPRMSKLQKLAIISPATGLMVYQTDDTTGFWYYKGSGWELLGAGAGGSLAPGTSVGNTPYWDGSQWVVNSSNIFNNGSVVGIGTITPDASAVIDINSSTGGMLIPRMTTTERNAIINPAEGLQIYNTFTKCFEFFDGASWQIISCGCIQLPAPTEAQHIRYHDGIEWKWNAVSGAIGYKYNTVNDLATAIDNGAGTTYHQTGLACNSNFNLYVWAYNLSGSCPHSHELAITVSTAACLSNACGIITFTYLGSPVTYGTVINPITGKCWLDRNLGASTVADSITDSNAYGDLFQWGRRDDGHQVRTSLTTTTLSNNDTPAHSRFIIAASSPYDWRSPQNATLWQGVSGTNNPCPTGWRIPTETETMNERLSWAPNNNYYGAFAGPLKLTAAGYKSYNTGITGGETTGGDYWTSTITGGYAKNLYTRINDAGSYNVQRAFALSIRCIKD